METGGEGGNELQREPLKLGLDPEDDPRARPAGAARHDGKPITEPEEPHGAGRDHIGHGLAGTHQDASSCRQGRARAGKAPPGVGPGRCRAAIGLLARLWLMLPPRLRRGGSRHARDWRGIRDPVQ